MAKFRLLAVRLSILGQALGDRLRIGVEARSCVTNRPNRVTVR